MDFALTEEQILLRDSVARFIEKDYGFDARQKLRARGGFDATHWHGFAEMGWLAAGVPEEMGGLGGPVETAIILEQLGRGLILEPVLGCGVLAPQLLIAAATKEQRETLLPGILEGESLLAAAFAEPGSRGRLDWVATRASAAAGRYTINGRKTFVLGGNVAQRFIVSGRTSGEVGDVHGISLFLVDRQTPGVRVENVTLIDGSHAAELVLDATLAEDALLGRRDDGLAALTCMFEHGVVALCAESVGLMEQAVEVTRGYLKTRQQFGVALATFQALQHKVADMVIDTQQSRAALQLALAAFWIEEPRKRGMHFSAAKSLVAEATRRVTGSAVQLHGGMGLAEEYPIGHFLQRMNVLEPILGNAAHHLGRYTAMMQAARVDAA